MWIVALCAAAIITATVVAQFAQVGTATTDIQLLAINDFHGALEPPSGGGGRIGSADAGGVEYLATHLARLKATNPNTIVVSAGDNVGGTPLLLLPGQFDSFSGPQWSIARAGEHEQAWAFTAPNNTHNTLGYDECGLAVRNAWVVMPSNAPDPALCTKRPSLTFR